MANLHGYTVPSSISLPLIGHSHHLSVGVVHWSI